MITSVREPAMTMTFEQAVARIRRARTFADLIETQNPGTNGARIGEADGKGANGAHLGEADGKGANRAHIGKADGNGTNADRHRTYRTLAKIVHPDAAGPARKEPATRAFAKLTALYEKPVAWREGDIAELFEDGDSLVKVPRSRADNDLMEAEAAALHHLHTHGHPDFRAYAPRLLRSELRDGRIVNVLSRSRGFRDLTGQPDHGELIGIWRRLLAGLGWAHRAGLVHTAVFEEHVLVDPRRRGLILIDWCYATRLGDRPKAIITKHERQYPPEVPAGEPVTPATDIHLATQLMTRLFGPDMPVRLRRFADGCLYNAPRMRPQDAWHLLTEFDELTAFVKR